VSVSLQSVIILHHQLDYPWNLMLRHTNLIDKHFALTQKDILIKKLTNEDIFYHQIYRKAKPQNYLYVVGLRQSVVHVYT